MTDKRVWIAHEDGELFLIRFDRDGTFFGYQHANVSGVVSALSDQAYARFIGDGEDTLTIWRLTAQGPVPVVVEYTRDEQISMIAVTLLWRERVSKGKFRRLSESGYYPMWEA